MVAEVGRAAVWTQHTCGAVSLPRRLTPAPASRRAGAGPVDGRSSRAAAAAPTAGVLSDHQPGRAGGAQLGGPAVSPQLRPGWCAQCRPALRSSAPADTLTTRCCVVRQAVQALMPLHCLCLNQAGRACDEGQGRPPGQPGRDLPGGDKDHAPRQRGQAAAQPGECRWWRTRAVV